MSGPACNEGKFIYQFDICYLTSFKDRNGKSYNSILDYILKNNLDENNYLHIFEGLKLLFDYNQENISLILQTKNVITFPYITDYFKSEIYSKMFEAIRAYYSNDNETYQNFINYIS